MTPEPSRPMTTAGLQAKVSLRRAWFEAHPNQPMPEGREKVERLFAAIEAEARAKALAQPTAETATPAGRSGPTVEQLAEALNYVDQHPSGGYPPALQTWGEYAQMVLAALDRAAAGEPHE